MGTYLFFASGPRPNNRASRPRTISIAAQLRKPSRAFVQSGFNEVVLTPALRAILCHATSQKPPDSQIACGLIQSCDWIGGQHGWGSLTLLIFANGWLLRSRRAACPGAGRRRNLALASAR